MKDGKGVKINTTETYNYGQVPGISDTIKAYEEYDVNMLKDPADKNDLSGPKNLGGKK